MFKILQRYVLREVLVPAVLALAILTFLVLARTVFSESAAVPVSLSLGVSLRLVAYVLPTLLTLTVPMALLVGVLLGIGRLTVDSEIKACRTHGVNLFRTFLPVLVLGGAVAGFELWNGTTFAPRMMARTRELVDQVTLDAINSLEPGKFQGGLDLQGQDAVVYFKEKDPVTGALGGVYVSVDTPAGAQDFGAKPAPRPRPSPLAGGAGEPRDGATTATAGQASGPRSSAASVPPAASAAARQGDGPPGSAPADGAGANPTVKTLFLAKTGRIATDLQTRSASLVLSDGTIHYLRSREDPSYDLLEFGVLTLQGRLKGKGAGAGRGLSKQMLAMTHGQLGVRMAELEAALPERVRQRSRAEQMGTAAVREIHQLGAERLSRISIALACFAFVLIGVPLAVYIRPSGKAVGVSISFALFMVYYGFWYIGLNLAKKGHPAGPVVLFLPFVLLVVLGGVMLYRVVRR